MEKEVTLSLSRDQIKVIMAEFGSLFKNPNFIHNLQHLAPNEQKINEAITAAQKEIFAYHQIDPEKGFADLGRIKDAYSNDKEILNLLVAAAQAEDVCITESMKNPHSHGHSHGHGHGHGHGQEQPKLSLSFEQVAELIKRIPQESGPSPQQMQIIQAAMQQFPQEQKVYLTKILMVRAGEDQRQAMKEQVEILKQKLPQMPPTSQPMVQKQIDSMEQMLESVYAILKDGVMPPTPTFANSPQPNQSQKSNQSPSMSKPSGHSMSKD